MYETKYIEHQNNIRVDSYMLRESQIGPKTSLNEENGDELLFYGLGIVLTRTQSSFRLVSFSEIQYGYCRCKRKRTQLLSCFFIAEIDFSCLFSTYSYVDILLEI